jgi:uncharacterized glyoxalase superfamily protein PhnB
VPQVTPYLLYEDGEAAIEFLTRAFGFRELDRTSGGAGRLQAREAGAEIVQEPAAQPYGYRRYGCRDPQGHEWFFEQPLG